MAKVTRTAKPKTNQTKSTYSVKKGALSQGEREYIERFYKVKSDVELGAELYRSPNQVENYRRILELKEAGGPAEREKEKYLNDLRAHDNYATLKTQFTKEEFVTFESRYVGILMQFKEVTYTEQEQIFDYICSSIYADRLGVERLQTIQQINKYTQLLDAMLEGVVKGEYTEQDTLMVEQRLSSLRGESSVKTQEYERVSKRKDDVLKQLKGTREQRIKKAEDAKVTVIGLLKMLDEEENRREAGIDLLLHQAAMEKEKQRLGALHTYENGEVDRPLLTYETVK